MKGVEQNLFDLAKTISGSHWNSLVDSVNDHCIRLAVNEGATYAWHRHPNSDEAFLVLEGKLVIEFEDGESKELLPGGFFQVTANRIHRTIAVGRTVNLCFEKTNAETIFLQSQPSEMNEKVVVTLETPDQPLVRDLLRLSDNYMADLYPAERNYLLPLGELTKGNVKFFVARIENQIAGCGALVLKEGYGEIKRMFVHPEFRGKSVGKEILRAIESLAASLHVQIVRLETGFKQPEALGLYKKFGFQETGAFGDYAADPKSVFMEKSLC